MTGFTFVGSAGNGALFNDGSTHTTQDLVIGQQSAPPDCTTSPTAAD